MTTYFQVCGLECGIVISGTSSASPSHVQGKGTAAAFDTVIVRNGARSMRTNPSSSIEGWFDFYVANLTNTKLVFRIAVKFATLPDVTTKLIGDALGVYFKASDSKLYTGTSIILLGATGVSVTTGVWYIIDLKIDTNASGGTIVTVDAQVDGVALGQSTTVIGIGSEIVFVRCGSSGTSQTHDINWDDMAVSNTLADYPIGNGYVHAFVPTSDGSHNVAGANDFERGTTGTDIINSTTTAYQLVDEVPLDSGTPDTDDYINCIAPPNATDYIEVKYGAAPGSSTPITGPRSIFIWHIHHEAGTGNCVAAAKLNSQGTILDVWNPGSVAGATTLRYRGIIRNTDPATSAAWTAANFNDLRLRWGYSSDATPDLYFDGTMIEAEFAPVVPTRRRQHTIEEE